MPNRRVDPLALINHLLDGIGGVVESFVGVGVVPTSMNELIDSRFDNVSNTLSRKCVGNNWHVHTVRFFNCRLQNFY